MSNQDEIIIVQDLHKHFGSVRALNGVSLSVERGRVVVIIGPSGSGKSTLLRCVNHLETPSSGDIWIDGEKLTTNQKQLNKIRAEIGMVFQLFNLFPHLSVLENVTLAQKVVRGRSGEEAEEIAMQLSKRASFRRTMKRAMEATMDAGAKGIKVQLAGRLGGAEMARREKQIRGSIPLRVSARGAPR